MKVYFAYLWLLLSVAVCDVEGDLAEALEFKEFFLICRRSFVGQMPEKLHIPLWNRAVI
jgi:hypothetical protein